MKSIVFKIKMITPTFMGGGNGRLDMIRTSGIKGMMRWWFRALAGGVVGDDLNKLKDLEGGIFGAAERKSNSSKSKFKIFLENLNLKFLQGQFDSSGFTYLGIGNVIFKYDKNNKKFILNPDKSNSAGNTLIDAESTFDVKIFFYPQVNEDDINLIAGSFYLATALGGFGLRARKCFGSWQIENCDGLDLKFNPTVYTEEGIKENINRLREIIKSKSNNRIPASQYPILDDSQFILSVIRTNEVNYQELLDKFGKLYRGFRVCAENPQPGLPGRGIHTSDFLRQASSAQNCKKVVFSNYKVRNALFGLNIVYPQLGNKSLQLEHIKDKKNNDKEVLRRASPVWFSVKEINGKLNLHITLFKSQFKPDGSSVKFDGRVVEIEDYSLIEQKFIPYIKQELEDKNG